MLRRGNFSLLVMAFAIFLSSCAPGVQYSLSPDTTHVPGTDIPEQLATLVADALTQTAFPPATSTPYPEVVSLSVYNTPSPASGSAAIPAHALFPYQTLYQSPALGIQFSYPSAWYRQTTSRGVTLTSFDPSNPPHKLEWTDQTVRVQFGLKVFNTRPAFDAWVEDAKQAAQMEGWSVYAEERFSIANQPAARLSLVSGSGGMLNRVLIYELNGRYFEINIEETDNNNLAKAVLDSIQPSYEGVLKPPDADTPAAGICNEAEGDPVSIVLGIGPDGIPFAGRCLKIKPSQRIKLMNQSNGPFNIQFGEYHIDLPVSGEILLDMPVGQYLALGVHFLLMGPELWM